MTHPTRWAAVTCAVVLLLGACASETPNDPQVATTGSESEDDETSADKSDREDGSGSNDKRKENAADEKPDDPTSAGADGKSDNKDGGGSQPDTGDSGEGSEDDSSSAAFPAAGRYTYAQSGWEEFCQAAACERQVLPDQQLVASKVSNRSSDGTTVVTEAHSSEGRVTRTTFRFTDQEALITKVYVRVQYEGFTFENTYDPNPPVESLRFPMEVGAAWSGSWRSQTSGDYSVSVTGREQVSVGGRAVNAFRIETSTDFRGEIQGHADITLWIDPATKALVKSVGDMRLKTAFGGYNTSFDIALRNAPGY